MVGYLAYLFVVWKKILCEAVLVLAAPALQTLNKNKKISDIFANLIVFIGIEKKTFLLHEEEVQRIAYTGK